MGAALNHEPTKTQLAVMDDVLFVRYSRGHIAFPCGEDTITEAAAILTEVEGVLVPSNIWPWPGNTRLPWQVWNEVPHPDGMTIYDPDGFRGDKPTIVTWDEFVIARGECTLVYGRGGREVLAPNA